MAHAKDYRMYEFKGEHKIITLSGTQHTQLAANLSWLVTSSASPPVLGFDLEWPITYQRGTPQIALMQLASSTRCLLVRLHKTDTLPACLEELLTGTTLVGFNIGNDLTLLRRKFIQLDGKGITSVELNQFANATIKPKRRWNLADLCSRVLEMKLDKSINHQAWSDHVLSKEHQRYARNDAAVVLVIYRILQAVATRATDRKADSPILSDQHQQGGPAEPAVSTGVTAFAGRLPELPLSFVPNLQTADYCHQLKQTYPLLSAPADIMTYALSLVQHVSGFAQSNPEPWLILVELRRILPGWNPASPFFRHFTKKSDIDSHISSDAPVGLTERRWEGPPRHMCGVNATKFQDTKKTLPTMAMADKVTSTASSTSLASSALADGYWWWWWWWWDWWRSHHGAFSLPDALTNVVCLYVCHIFNQAFLSTLPPVRRRVMVRHCYGELALLVIVLDMSGAQRVSLVRYMSLYAKASKTRTFFSSWWRRLTPLATASCSSSSSCSPSSDCGEPPGAFQLIIALMQHGGFLDAFLVTVAPRHPNRALSLEWGEARLRHRADLLWIDAGFGREWHEPRWHSSPKNLQYMDKANVPSICVRERLGANLFPASLSPAAAKLVFATVDSWSPTELQDFILNGYTKCLRALTPLALDHLVALVVQERRNHFEAPKLRLEKEIMTRCAQHAAPVGARVGRIREPERFRPSRSLRLAGRDVDAKCSSQAIPQAIPQPRLSFTPDEVTELESRAAQQLRDQYLCLGLERFIWKLVSKIRCTRRQYAEVYLNGVKPFSKVSFGSCLASS